MAGINNERLIPTNEGQIQRIDCRYEDETGTLWQVSATGTPEKVQQFIDERPILLNLVPLEAYPQMPIPPELFQGYHFPAIPSTRDLAIPEAPPLTETELLERGLPELEVPSLEISMGILRRTIEPPYVFSFLHDPSLNSAARTYRTTFYLEGVDITANIWLENVSPGFVKLSVFGPNNLRAKSSIPPFYEVTCGKATTYGSLWTVKVELVSGTPSFAIRGDVVVEKLR